MNKIAHQGDSMGFLKAYALCRLGSSQQWEPPWNRSRLEHLPLCLMVIRAANQLRQGPAAE